MTTTLVLLVIAVGFAVARFLVPVEGKINNKDIFKDTAHLFVGFAFGCAYHAWSDWELWAIPIALTVVEVIAFVVRKK